MKDAANSIKTYANYQNVGSLAALFICGIVMLLLLYPRENAANQWYGYICVVLFQLMIGGIILAVLRSGISLDGGVLVQYDMFRRVRASIQLSSSTQVGHIVGSEGEIIVQVWDDMAVVRFTSTIRDFGFLVSTIAAQVGRSPMERRLSDIEAIRRKSDF